MVIWGVRNRTAIGEQLRRGGDVCILERGYLGDRFAWASVSFGGQLNGRAEFHGVSNDGSRFSKHFGHLMQPWRRKDGYALLIGQVPGDMSLAKVNGSLDKWYAETATALTAKGYKVRFRAHPVALKRGRRFIMPRGIETMGGPLDGAMAGASLVVTYNSNTGVEAVLAGVPTVAFDCGSMAWPVTGHAVDEVVTPDREEWAAQMAWKQWTLDEMRSGECWAHVGNG
jgi:hypothetical protein